MSVHGADVLVLMGTGKNRHRITVSNTVCFVSLLTPGIHSVNVSITHGTRRVAAGIARVHNRRARVAMRTLRRLRRGRYVVTVVAAIGRRVSVFRTPIVLGGA